MERTKPIMLWLGIEGSFDCICGESHIVEDCMLPATVVCPTCDRFWRIDFSITATEKQEAQGASGP